MVFRVSVVLRGEDQAGRRMWKLKGAEAMMEYWKVLLKGYPVVQVIFTAVDEGRVVVTRAGIRRAWARPLEPARTKEAERNLG